MIKSSGQRRDASHDASTPCSIEMSEIGKDHSFLRFVQEQEAKTGVKFWGRPATNLKGGSAAPSYPLLSSLLKSSPPGLDNYPLLDVLQSPPPGLQSQEGPATGTQQATVSLAILTTREHLPLNFASPISCSRPASLLGHVFRMLAREILKFTLRVLAASFVVFWLCVLDRRLELGIAEFLLAAEIPRFVNHVPIDM